MSFSFAGTRISIETNTPSTQELARKWIESVIQLRHALLSALLRISPEKSQTEKGKWLHFGVTKDLLCSWFLKARRHMGLGWQTGWKPQAELPRKQRHPKEPCAPRSNRERIGREIRSLSGWFSLEPVELTPAPVPKL